MALTASPCPTTAIRTASNEYLNYLARLGLKAPTITVEMAGESGLQTGAEVELTQRTHWYDYEAGSAVFSGATRTHEAFFTTHLASQWLAEHARDPFFLAVSPWGPHPPYTVPDSFRGTWPPNASPVCANLDFDLHGRPQHHEDYREYWRQTLAPQPYDRPGPAARA